MDSPLPASALSKGRVRIGLHTKNAPYRRCAETRALICHGCRATLNIGDDEQLRKAMHERTWSLYHWKTYLCAECHCRAALNAVELEPGTYCMACQRCTYTLVKIPTLYAEANDASARRMLYLCAPCVACDTAQLQSVAAPLALISAMRDAVQRKRDAAAASAGGVERKASAVKRHCSNVEQET
jgi:RNase P subunit RPR2